MRPSILPLVLLTACLVLTPPVEAQLGLSFSTVFSEGGCEVLLSGGVPEAPAWVGIDTAVGETRLDNGIQLDLALTPAFTVLPPVVFDESGQNLMKLLLGGQDQRGMRFYAQAVTADPASARFQVSAMETVVVHPRKPEGGSSFVVPFEDEALAGYTPTSMVFTLYGQEYTSIAFTSNGRLLFEGGGPSPQESQSAFLSGKPGVAIFWHDLDPGSGGSVTVTESLEADWVSFEYASVPQAGTSDASTGRATLYSDGSVTLSYGPVALQEAIVGITPGYGISQAPDTDLSRLPAFENAPGDAVFEQFTTPLSPFDLEDSVVTFLRVGQDSYSVIYN